MISQVECCLFVDEAGDPILFNRSGRIVVDTPGRSRFFIVGMLEVEDPDKLARSLLELRQELLKDPYFSGVPSFLPERRKTALLFHAKDDLPEVRYRVFSLLRAAGSALRFRAVVRDKQALLQHEIERRTSDPAYRYQPDSVYDGLIRSLFSGLRRAADMYQVCVAKRGAKDRNTAIRSAIHHAEDESPASTAPSHDGSDPWQIVISNPRETVCLQAVDYFLWAVQRFYETRRHEPTGQPVREDRFLKLLWPQIDEIHDFDFGAVGGTRFYAERPLLLHDRFGSAAGDEEASRV